ncbi:MAG: hypothetical protein AB8H86_20740 [Polyangiales bacterium]
MKRKPQSWTERFDASLEVHPSPALEDWRWAREGEGKADERAIAAAWDLVTQQASAETAKIHHILTLLGDPMERTFLPSLVVAGVRCAKYGTYRVIDPEGKDYWPRDLAFVPGREHLTPELTLRCHVEVGRAVVNFLISYTHTDHLTVGEEGSERFEPVSATRTMAILLGERSSGRKDEAKRRVLDIELLQEGHLVVRYERSELWADSIGCATEALRTLVQSTRFDVDQRMAERLQ